MTAKFHVVLQILENKKLGSGDGRGSPAMGTSPGYKKTKVAQILPHLPTPSLSKMTPLDKKNQTPESNSLK